MISEIGELAIHRKTIFVHILPPLEFGNKAGVYPVPERGIKRCTRYVRIVISSCRLPLYNLVAFPEGNKERIMPVIPLYL